MLSGNRLKLARQRAGLSQVDVAEHLGISRQSISKWENGRTFPDFDNLSLLCDLYGISLDYAFGVDSNSAKASNDEKEKDESILLLMLTGVIALIPIGQIFLPFYVLWRNKKSNNLYTIIIVANTLVILLGIYTTYNIISTIIPISVN